MTPYSHTTGDTHVNVYRQDLQVAIAQSRQHPGALHSLRRHIARGLVRAGAWLMPDKPETVDGTVVALAGPRTDSIDRRAA